MAEKIMLLRQRGRPFRETLEEVDPMRVPASIREAWQVFRALVRDSYDEPVVSNKEEFATEFGNRITLTCLEGTE